MTARRRLLRCIAVGLLAPAVVSAGLITSAGSRFFSSLPPSGGTAQLSWTAPAQNTDDSGATITGYNIYAGANVNDIALVTSVGAGSTTYTFTGLSPGTYYFTVKSVNSLGVESAMSEYVTTTIP